MRLTIKISALALTLMSVSSGVPIAQHRWLVQARLDWLSASIGDYSGGLWNTQVGINWQAFRHFGIGLNYNAFVVNVDIDKTDWQGKADTIQRGPFLAITAT